MAMRAMQGRHAETGSDDGGTGDGEASEAARDPYMTGHAGGHD
ncbi:hypothetical protein [Sphingomonas solaris]|nr:hypothetical protein [Sphingomonas solaris]